MVTLTAMVHKPWSHKKSQAASDQLQKFKSGCSMDNIFVFQRI